MRVPASPSLFNNFLQIMCFTTYIITANQSALLFLSEDSLASTKTLSVGVLAMQSLQHSFHTQMKLRIIRHRITLSTHSHRISKDHSINTTVSLNKCSLHHSSLLKRHYTPLNLPTPLLLIKKQAAIISSAN